MALGLRLWPPTPQAPAADLTLLVCCHSARDARCGQLGPPLAAALRQLVRQRGLQDQVGPLTRWRCCSSSHAAGTCAHAGTQRILAHPSSSAHPQRRCLCWPPRTSAGTSLRAM